MSSHRVFVVLALPLAFLASVPAAAGQQPDRNIAAATGCDLDAFERARAEFERLQTVKRFMPDQVSVDQLTAAANAYAALGERCYQALYANATEKIDDGGVWVDADGVGRFVTWGTKWGAGTQFPPGQDIPGPGIAGGTVTYSFMLTGVSNATESSNNPNREANTAISSLPGFQACFLTDITTAFAAWSAIANIQFVEVADNGVAWNGSGAAGDIRIGSHQMEGPLAVLAHAYFPPPNGATAAGDMHFDREENWSCSPGAGLVDIGLVALHEIGHSIGLSHQSTQRLAVMNPAYNQNLTGLLPDDINGARAIYGVGGIVPDPISSDDLLSDFGSFGLWQLFDGNTTSGWVLLHDVSPKSIVTGDLDGNGFDEIIADFASFGIWVRLNNLAWFQLHPATANRMATGDLDGNGGDEVIIDFPGFGLWVWNNTLSFWSQLHPTSPTNFVTGNWDGVNNPQDEVIVDFAGFGIWVWWNNAVWTQLHTSNSSLLAVGDFDANPRGDIIIVFPGAGIWKYANRTTWSQVHPSEPVQVAVGDIDHDGLSDFIGDFGDGIGVWKLQSSTSGWAQISTLVSTQLLVGDLNGNGKAEVIANFGASGLYLYADNNALFQIHPVSPEALAVGDFNSP